MLKIDPKKLNDLIKMNELDKKIHDNLLNQNETSKDMQSNNDQNNNSISVTYNTTEVTNNGYLVLNISHQLRIPFYKNQTQILENCFIFKIKENQEYNNTLLDWKDYDNKIVINKRNLEITNITVT